MCVVRHFFIFLVARFLFFFAFKSFTFSCSLDSSTFQRGMWWKEPWRVKDQSQVKKEKKKKRKNKRIQKKARPLFVLIYLEVKRRVLNPTQTFVNKYMFVLMWANLRLKKAACHAKKGKEWDRENERERERERKDVAAENTWFGAHLCAFEANGFETFHQRELTYT